VCGFRGGCVEVRIREVGATRKPENIVSLLLSCRKQSPYVVLSMNASISTISGSRTSSESAETTALIKEGGQRTTDRALEKFLL